MNRLSFSFFLIVSFQAAALLSTSIKPIITYHSDHETNIQLAFNLDQNDFIYKEYIQLSVDNPNVVLSDWQCDTEPTIYYDQTFKDKKQIYNNNFTLNLCATCKSDALPEGTSLRVNYYPHNKGSFCETIIPLAANNKNAATSSVQQTIQNNNESRTAVGGIQRSQRPTKKTEPISWKDSLTNLIKTTKYTWVRFLLIFLLGVLFSLTPCIYPMIPITIGVLQAQASKSVIRNFLTALLYTLGLSTTFAILGLLAAFAGQRMESYMTNPWVIGIVVALLVYVALSLFDLYELRIPSFLKQKKTVYTGSLLSAFVFGAISGTVASPCVSPGLFLVLTLVSNFKSLFLGFLLLLSFGFGISLPLLIIGTFSTSLGGVLPKAGKWMVEIKHGLGFLMLGMCFYFLQFLLPWYLLLMLFALYLVGAGIFYLYGAQKEQSNMARIIKTILGIVLIGSSVFFVVKGFQTYYLTPKE